MKKVTLGWDGEPTILNDDGTVFPRSAELIFNAKYYPNWPEQMWPVDPETGEKLPMEDRAIEAFGKPKNRSFSDRVISLFISRKRHFLL